MPIVERNVLPDAIVRFGVRRQCADRLAEISKGSAEEQAAAKEAMVEELKSMPIAVQQAATYVSKLSARANCSTYYR
eukprot:9360-Heterococcus_DN1.PRE.2